MSNANKLKLIAMIVGLLLAVVLIIQNTQQVRTRLLFATVEMPAALLLIVTLLIGIAVGALGTWIYFVRKRRR